MCKRERERGPSFLAAISDWLSLLLPENREDVEHGGIRALTDIAEIGLAVSSVFIGSCSATV